MNSIRVLSALSLASLQVATSYAVAAVPSTNINRSMSFSVSQDFSRGLDFSLIQPMESTRDTKSEDVQKMIPTDIAPTSSTSQVANKIIDHSVNNYLNSPSVKNSSFGRTTSKFDKSMTGDMTLGGSAPESVKHNFKFAMQAAQTKASVEYTGYTNAELTYKASESTIDLQVHEKVAMLGTQLVFNHTIKPSDTRDVVSLKWVW